MKNESEGDRSLPFTIPAVKNRRRSGIDSWFSGDPVMVVAFVWCVPMKRTFDELLEHVKMEKRLGTYATHQSTTTQTPDEMLAKAPKQINAEAKKDDEFVEALLRNPEARRRIQEMIQKQVEDWVRQKIPALGSRTPLQAISNPDGREIVEFAAPGLGAPDRRRSVSTGNPPGLRCRPQTAAPPRRPDAPY
jgi:hypothetical protein